MLETTEQEQGQEGKPLAQVVREEVGGLEASYARQNKRLRDAEAQLAAASKRKARRAAARPVTCIYLAVGGLAACWWLLGLLRSLGSEEAVWVVMQGAAAGCGIGWVLASLYAEASEE
jgi:hypothetical protein